MNSHYCPEWDYMIIDESCPEYECCTCFKKEENEIPTNTNPTLHS